MRKIISSLTVILALILGCFCLIGCDECSETPPPKPANDEIIYELNAQGTGYVVTGRKTGYYTLVEIPATHEGLPVVAIKANAFKGANIIRVVIPASVEYIGQGAFANCSKLTSAQFGLPNTWSAGGIGLDDIDVANNQTAAGYLKSTYSNVAWERDREPSASMGDLSGGNLFS